MTCAHCEQMVETMLRRADATDAQADRRRVEATFSFDGDLARIHAVAPNAGDVILAGLYAVEFGLTVQVLADTSCCAA